MEDTNQIPLWIQFAKKEIGQKEIRGGENPRILEYHSTTTLKATEDEVPWCAAFVGWCLLQAGLPHTRSAAALSYKKYGHRLSEPVYGCIVVFQWNEVHGHVGFFMGWAGKNLIRVLGGNQKNEVRILNYSTDRIVAYVWPSVEKHNVT